MLEDIVITLQTVERQLDDAQDLFQMAEEEDDDATLLSIQRDIGQLEKTVAKWNSAACFPIRWTPTIASSIFNPVPGVPKHRIGPRCWSACTCAIASAAAMAWK